MSKNKLSRRKFLKVASAATASVAVASASGIFDRFFSPSVVSAAPSLVTQASYYVSPSGSDSNAGTLAAPFLTITKARDVVRTINSSMTGDIFVYLRGGTYNIASTIAFGSQDSGTNGFRIYYQAYSGETPVLNGGTQVTGWTQHSGSIYKATLNSSNKLRTLIVNDKRAYMASKDMGAQGGSGTYNITAGQASWAWVSGSTADGVQYNTGDIPSTLTNIGDVEIQNTNSFTRHYVGVRGITTSGSYRVLQFQQPMGAIAINQYFSGFQVGGWHTIANAFEFLDSPGEFYFNRSTHTLYYYKNASDDMSTATVYAPQLGTVFSITGNSTTNRVKNITFKGLTVVNTESILPSVGGSSGKTTTQAACWSFAFNTSNWHLDQYAAYDVTPSVCRVKNADSITFERNIFKHIGLDGIGLENDVVNSTLLGNYFQDIGGGAILVGHPQHVYATSNGAHELFPAGIKGICTNNLVKDNLIYDTTTMFVEESPITGFLNDGLKIEHNYINQCNYNGVSLGWNWQNQPNSTTCRNNTFNYNKVLNSCSKLADDGHIYMLGQQPNSVMTGDYVEGSKPYHGVYADEGSAYWTVSNIVMNTGSSVEAVSDRGGSGLHDEHYDNIYWTNANQGWCGATNSTYTNFHPSCNPASWPTAAQNIINGAGLESGYTDLLNLMTSGPTPTPVGPTPTPVAGRYEAESAALSGGAAVFTDHTGYSGTGFVSGYYTGTGQKTSFTVNVASAGSYNVTLRYTNSMGSAQTESIYVNGVKVATPSYANLANWDTWADSTTALTLNAGNNTIAYQKDTGNGCINLDYITVQATTGPTPTPTRTQTPGGSTATPTRTPTPSGTFPVPGTYYRIINRNSGKCLDVYGNSTADGANVDQWTSNGGQNQQWSFVAQTGGYYEIIARSSGKALEVAGSSTADGANVDQYTWNGANNQQWTLTALTGGYYKLINRNSGKALDVVGNGTADGVNVDQWADNGGNNQQWQIIP